MANPLRNANPHLSTTVIQLRQSTKLDWRIFYPPLATIEAILRCLADINQHRGIWIAGKYIGVCRFERGV